MPSTRRARISGGPATKGAQSTLSFGGGRSKVTKQNTNVSKDVKDKVITAPAKVDEILQTSDIQTSVVETEEVLNEEPGHVSSEVLVAKQAAVELAKPKTKEEELAEKVSDAQIKKYWRAREADRLAPRVHQEGLTVEEKILRLFDMSSNYGVSFRPPPLHFIPIAYHF
jgi:DNA polymerase delta subunit 4